MARGICSGAFGLALAASIACVVAPPVHAQTAPYSLPVTIGQTVYNPATDTNEVVTSILSNVTVQTASGAAIFMPQTVGDTFVGPDNITYKVTATQSQPINGTSHVVSVTLENQSTKATQPQQVSFAYTGTGVAGTGSTAVPFTQPAGNSNMIVHVLQGTAGAKGADGAVIVPAATGGAGAVGPAMNYDITGNVTITAVNRVPPGIAGITIASIGGNGGPGGNSTLNLAGGGGAGGAGGNGGPVNVTVGPGVTVNTGGDALFGIFVQSAGGSGGPGGTSAATTGGGGPGGAAGAGGSVSLVSSATINTSGSNSHGIYAQSIGGAGGSGGNSFLSVVGSGSGSYGGNGGPVSVIQSGRVQTSGPSSFGVLAQSVGGNGGFGGILGVSLVSLGNGGGPGGNGGDAAVAAADNSVTLTSGQGSIGLMAQSVGGGGGIGGSGAALVKFGAQGGVGGNGGQASLVIGTGASVVTSGVGADGAVAQSLGGGGGLSAFAGGFGALVSVGSSGGSGGNADAVFLGNDGFVRTSGQDARGLVAQSIGGGGGSASGAVGLIAIGGGGGSGGGSAGQVIVNQSSNGSVVTSGDGAHGIAAQSIGGGGGSGGFSLGLIAIGGAASGGGDAGLVSVANYGTIQTGGKSADGILAQSIGGGGGSGGFAGSIGLAIGGTSGGGGNAGDVSIDLSGSVLTGVGGSGENSSGIVAQSVGGGGGVAGGAGTAELFGGGLAIGGSGGNGGSAGNVTLTFRPYTLAAPGGAITLLSRVVTTGDGANGIAAQSVGGGGGIGGFAGELAIGGGLSAGLAIGGSGGGGGSAGNVQVTGDVFVRTQGNNAAGIDIASIGGGGGAGGFAGNLNLKGGGASLGITVGGGGGLASNGGIATYSGLVDLATTGANSNGFTLSSVGGGGGFGGISGTIARSLNSLASVGIAVGGAGGGGGNGGTVTLNSGGIIAATGDDSRGLTVQSVGGGGGIGGATFSLTPGAGSLVGTSTVNVTVGGSGGGGGSGGDVNANFGGSVTTSGDRSLGVLAQSVGGGGGIGGFAMSGGTVFGGAGAGFAIAAGVGGSGGTGGSSGQVTANIGGNIATSGIDARAVVIQSVGGGGGMGGFATGTVAAVSATSGTIGVGVGGSGGGGGNSGATSGTILGSVSTLGFNSDAVTVQSVGGGGGIGGMSLAVAAGSGLLSPVNVAVGVGGTGGGGGNGADVTAAVAGPVYTSGNSSRGVYVQSIGGGGGAGGLNIAGSAAYSLLLQPTVATIGVGGAGGGGGSAGAVHANASAITTLGSDAPAFLAQSIGGGGGAGGVSVSGSVAISMANAGAVTVGIGGSGGKGGAGSSVEANITGPIATFGDRSFGALAQSVGGGGGYGGLAVTGALTASLVSSVPVVVGIGGSGGDGGNAASASLATGSIQTSGANADAFTVQSIGGGGGKGGGSVSGALAISVLPGSVPFAMVVGIGGAGGGGGDAAAATGTVAGNIFTNGKASKGAVVQSIGGDGGSGGFNVGGALAVSLINSGAVNIGIGGVGGDGGNAGNVSFTQTGAIQTTGEKSQALVVQSIGGGGGDGGFLVNGAASLSAGIAANLGLSIGGLGGKGGKGGTVDVTINSGLAGTDPTLLAASTSGKDATAIVAQSIGGTGGNGGFVVNGSASMSFVSGNAAIGIGGAGGGGGSSDKVTADISGAVFTEGDGSGGILVQSAGGGGGSGGFVVNGAINIAALGATAAIGIGGKGGGGGNGSDARFTGNALIQTLGANADALVVESIGGGGGSGGFNIAGAGQFSIVASAALGLGIGGMGGDGGSAAGATATMTGPIVTRGVNSRGMVVQSLGGGGGSGGFDITGTIVVNTGLPDDPKDGSIGGKGLAGALAIGIGGMGGLGGNGGIVTASGGSIATIGDRSTGFTAQSVGGGGGVGGFNISGSITAAAFGSVGNIGVGIGGRGGGGGNGGAVTAKIDGNVSTQGKLAGAIFVQSVGGGGGSGGFNIQGGLAFAPTGSAATVNVGIGGAGGLGGNGSDVTLALNGEASTRGDSSNAVLVQSVGGGGGAGGFNITGGISLSPGTAATVGVGIGGFGGGGGSGGKVTATFNSDILTVGDDSRGALIQSVGGGGGVGGFNITAGLSGAMSLDTPGTKAIGGGSTATAAALGFGLGGFGGGGGNAGEVGTSYTGTIETFGLRSDALLVQSVGGSGGAGGFNVTGNVTLGQGNGYVAGFGLGGFGGGGGSAQKASLNFSGSAISRGAQSNAIAVQSIGGGGGSGGFNITGGLSIVQGGSGAAGGIGIGGFGGGGGNAGMASATVRGTAAALDNGTGVLVQSVGGSGGSGGFNVTAQLSVALASNSNASLPSVSNLPSPMSSQSGGSSGPLDGPGRTASIGLGGFGGAGGNGSDVSLILSQIVQSDMVVGNGDNQYAVLAQSIGGGGGRGGFNFSGGLASSGAIGVGLGGFGGAGGTSGTVFVNSTMNLHAAGLNTAGLLAQSIGGGGGAGGFNFSGAFVAGSSGSSPAVSFGLGGFGGTGNKSAAVTVIQLGDVSVMGENARGIVAQSIGGGGGSGGLNIAVSGTLSQDKNGIPVAIGIGGYGGTGADAGAVQLTAQGLVLVNTAVAADGSLIPGYQANGGAGIVAQSIGGGGGSGGFNISGALAPFGNPVVIGIGGGGGVAGNGGDVTVITNAVSTGQNAIAVSGANAYGLHAQSIGGGGGSGGFNLSLPLTLDPQGDHPYAIAIGVGGSGASGGNAGNVTVQHDGLIYVRGANSVGLSAQSIAGGGGDAGINAVMGDTKNVTGVTIAIGGGTGDGGKSGEVRVTQSGLIVTSGAMGIGLQAQSIGGGGGNVGNNQTYSTGASGGVTLEIGRLGGTGGVGGKVNVVQKGDIYTDGVMASALVAQSIGGGGGNSGSVNIGTSGSIGSGSLAPSYATSLSIGLAGGQGATSDQVTVDNSGLLATQGDMARGIFAQSIGGGGGNGGDASSQLGGSDVSLAIALGGTGGNGAAGGNTTISNSGTIATAGIFADAIFAQSVGGGGGAAGAANTSLASFDPNSLPNPVALSFNIALGGTGGTGGTGSRVEVSNSGRLQTLGDGSAGIKAQSIGGGGGQGGAVSVQNGTSPVSSPVSGLVQSVNVGGSGGTGGVGGDVQVANTGRIETMGARAIGIYAQSIGGGGGDGGAIATLSPPTGSNPIAGIYSLNIGGAGGTGGVGGNVSVANQRTVDGALGVIVTHGTAAHGIVAQSIGGGGGNGAAIQLAALGGLQGATLTAGFSIGGSGGSGNDAGTVTVRNDAVISTSGERAVGILAQSIGGGGGNGEGAILGGANLVQALTAPLVAVGGIGGAGGNGGNVEVDNSGIIFTTGAYAHGIVAQSVAGGGGNASLAVSGNAIVSHFTDRLLLRIGATNGVAAAGQPGTATVHNSSSISVSGYGALALLSQEIHGGGGGVNVDLGPMAGYETAPGTPGPTPKIVIKQGAQGGSGLAAGTNTVDNQGILQATGMFSAGGFIQAIGGGGGIGLYRLSMPAGATLPGNISGTASAIDFAIDLGGQDLASSSGGNITASYAGTLLTTGFASPGHLAQSIGGGGGRIVLDIYGTGNETGTLRTLAIGNPVPASTLPASTLTAQLGGTNVAGSPGGTISFVQGGMMATTADLSPGAILQSIGGGGGYMTVNAASGAAPGAALDAVLGASGNGANDGGAISANFSGGILTQGNAAPGLIVQSIGGGGGLLGVGGMTLDNVSLGAGSGASGNGGAVNLVNLGDIETQGADSHAVLVQSIGGGGGIVLGAGDSTSVSLSTGGAGSGGNIDFAQTGNLIAYGLRASALVMQSIGGGGGVVDGPFFGGGAGTGAGGSVNASLDGTVAALGDGVTAVKLQSLGSTGAGDISLILAPGGMIYAGTGGIAVQFDGGSANIFDSSGTVMTADGVQGVAMIASTGNDVVRNSGMVVGNLDLGAGVNQLLNLQGASFLSGTLLNLGSSANQFSNAGNFAPGGTANVVQTSLGGSFLQSVSGTSFLDVNLQSDAFDALNATGTALVAGTIDVSLLNPLQFRPGFKSYEVYTANGGAVLQGANLRADKSVVFNLLGLANTANAIAVQYNMTFAPANLQGDQVALGHYLDRFQTAGPPASVYPTTGRLISEQDPAVYADLLTQLGAGFYARQDALAIEQAIGFGRVMANCGNAAGESQVKKGSTCAWAKASFASGSSDSMPGAPGTGNDTNLFSGGARYEVKPDLSLALAVGYSDISMDGYGNLWRAQGHGVQLGAGMVFQTGATEFSAFVGYGNARFDTARQLPGFGTAVTGSRNVDVLSLETRAAYHFVLGGLTLQPSLTVGLASLGGGSQRESGDESVDLALDPSRGTYGWIVPELSAGYTAAISQHFVIHPYLGIGLRQYLSSSTVRTAARFSQDTSGVEPFLATASLGRSGFVGEVGVEFHADTGFSFGASYRTDRSSQRQHSGAQVFVSLTF